MAALHRILRQAQPRVFTPEAASTAPHRLVLSLLAQGFASPEVTILCEPSLVHTTLRPPDLVVIDPLSGVHVVEVKSVYLKQIERRDPGGALQIKYKTGARTKHPVQQVRTAMFDIKTGAERAFEGQLTTPFQYWVVFPSIARSEWEDRWGVARGSQPEVLFADDLRLPQLVDVFQSAGRKVLERFGLVRCPEAQLRAVLEAFGDAPEPRRSARLTEPAGGLGERFDLASAAYKRLSQEQQRLAEQIWDGPRLIRGVAGSGKTVVLAHNCARRLARAMHDTEGLFGGRTPRVLAVCFNRTLAPFLRSRIHEACRVRTGDSVPDGMLDVFSLNGLMWHLKDRLWSYQRTKDTEASDRARHYITSLDAVPESILERCLYDAIYVDEGQDFEPEEFQLLMRLCRANGGDPAFFVFYDDAQNLYGKTRPNWGEIGLNVVGRSTVMTRCFRNTRQIVEPAFNMLVGAYADRIVQNRQYADVAGLSERGLVEETESGHFRIQFTDREGLAIEPFNPDSIDAEGRWLLVRLQKLLVEEEVRPEDVLILTLRRERAARLADMLATAGLPISGIRRPYADAEKDEPISTEGCLTVSTVHSAKGYDAYVVLIVGVEDFEDSEEDRAALYVACTRARELLEVTGVGKAPLARELARATRAMSVADSQHEGEQT